MNRSFSLLPPRNSAPTKNLSHEPSSSLALLQTGQMAACPTTPKAFHRAVPPPLAFLVRNGDLEHERHAEPDALSDRRRDVVVGRLLRVGAQRIPRDHRGTGEAPGGGPRKAKRLRWPSLFLEFRRPRRHLGSSFQRKTRDPFCPHV